jgi:hypothetical protein
VSARGAALRPAHRTPGERPSSLRPAPRRVWRALWLWLLLTGTGVQAGPHVHGVAAIDIAVEGRALVVLVDVPLDSLVGFERAPRTAVERRAAADALARMRDASAWLGPDAAARCRLGEVRVQAPVLEAVPSAATPAPRDSAAGRDDTHADLQAEVRFDCDEPGQLTSLRVGLADVFKRIRRIDVQVAGPQGQSRAVLRGAARTVRLVR